MLKEEMQSNVQNVQQKSQGAYMLLTLITQQCHGVMNTTFTAPDPKPTWFDDLNTKLDSAKTVAADWVNNIAPGVTGGVPVQVIDYGTTYAALSAQIQDIVKAHPDAYGSKDPYVKQVHELVAAIEGSISRIITNAQNTSDSLKDWGKKMQKAHDALSSGTASIQNAEVELETNIDEMNSAIKSLNDSIAAENKAIAGAAIGIGVGIFLTIAGIALAPETGGASLVVAGTGALMVIGGAVTWGIMQSKIDKQFKEIAKDQKQLDNDKRQIVALKGLESASNTAIGYTITATTALSEFRTSWSVFQGELSGVLAKLQKAEGSLSTIVAGAFTAAAEAEWKIATAYAENLAAADVKVVKKDMPMDSTAA